MKFAIKDKVADGGYLISNWVYEYVDYRSVEFCIEVINIRPFAKKERMKAKVIIGSKEETIFKIPVSSHVVQITLQSNQDRQPQS